MMNCTNCGAPQRSAGTECHYCGTLLARPVRERSRREIPPPPPIPKSAKRAKPSKPGKGSNNPLHLVWMIPVIVFATNPGFFASAVSTVPFVLLIVAFATMGCGSKSTSRGRQGGNCWRIGW